MENKAIQMTIFQKYIDKETGVKQQWEQKVTGTLLQLKTFNKITYQDQEQRKVQLKWDYSLEHLTISYEQGVFYFKPTVITQTTYQTPQGNLLFDVQTHKLLIRENEIKVNYQLLLENKPVGSYQFRLIYRS